MASKTTKGVRAGEWIARLRAQAGRGVYVWGGNGQRLDTMANPEAWIEKRETSAENAARAKRLYRLRRDAGIAEIRAFDCSGLLYWTLKGLRILDRDVSAQGLYDRCKPLADADELQPGDMVFRHNGERIVHVGAYIGNGKVIECLGRDDGVTETALAKRNFNRFGRLVGAFLKEPQDESEQAGDAATQTERAAAQSESAPVPYVQIKGGSVRVRAGGSTAFRTLQIAHAGERYRLLGTAQGGWHRIDLGGAIGYITPNPKYTEVIEYA